MAGPVVKKRPRSAGGAADVEAQSLTPSAKRRRTEQTRTLFVRSLAPSVNDESLTEFFSQHYPIKHATVVLDSQTKSSRGYGFVTFADVDDAREASEKLQNSALGGKAVQLELAQPRNRDVKGGKEADGQAKEKREALLAEERKPPKLIVRNLPWSIKKSDQLAALFRSYGLVKFSDLPQSKGKLAGFGFVTIRGRKNAERAMEGVNGKVVDGRTLSVEFAVDKTTWESQQATGDDETPKKAEKAQGKQKALKTEPSTEKQDGESDTDDEDADLKHFAMNYMDELESESSGEEDEDEDEGSGDESDGGAPADEDEAEASVKEAKKPLTTDNSSTLFLRNLPYTTTDDELKSHFAQFGPVRYARVVVDRQTDRPAGTGFVCFFNVADSKACLRAAPRPQQTAVRNKGSILQDSSVDADGRYTLGGRVMQVTQAVSKDEATRLSAEETKKAERRDTRHLYLLSEGTISKSSPAFPLLAPSELKMREASFNQRRKLLQGNPTLHLSLTRLALRNIPRNMGAKELKALAREAVVGFARDVKEGRREALSKDEVARGGEADRDAEHQRRLKGKGVVKQAKIVFESNQGSKVPEKSGAGKSRGYGFLEFSSHRWALMGLRWLNGHALKNDAGKTQRLIVEFSIENAQVVNRRRELETRSRGRTGMVRPAVEGPGKTGKTGKTGNTSNTGRGNGAPKNGAKAATSGAGRPKRGNSGKEASKEKEKPSLDTHIIARKRLMRKKNVSFRKGGK